MEYFVRVYGVKIVGVVYVLKLGLSVLCRKVIRVCMVCGV